MIILLLREDKSSPAINKSLFSASVFKLLAPLSVLFCVSSCVSLTKQSKSANARKLWIVPMYKDVKRQKFH